MKQAIILMAFLVLPLGASGQTIDEQWTKAFNEIDRLCALDKFEDKSDLWHCIVKRVPGTCPDPLAGTREQLRQLQNDAAAMSSQLSTAATRAFSYSQTAGQVLTDNPVP